jgi:hypothetical protein
MTETLRRLTIRLPQSIADDLTARAGAKSASLSSVIVEALQNVGSVNENREGQGAQSAAEKRAEKAIRDSRPAATLYKRVTRSLQTKFLALESDDHVYEVGEVRNGSFRVHHRGRYDMSMDELREALRDGSVTKIG